MPTQPAVLTDEILEKLKTLQVIGPDAIPHPWTEEIGWESMDLCGGTISQHSRLIKKLVKDGWEIYIRGQLEDTDIPAAYLIRKL